MATRMMMTTKMTLENDKNKCIITTVNKFRLNFLFMFGNHEDLVFPDVILSRSEKGAKCKSDLI